MLQGLAVIAFLSPAPTATSVLHNVQTYYANTKQLTTKFEQKVTTKAYGSVQNSKGTVRLAKPDKMRWDYDPKRKGGAKKSFIFDGKTLWIVEPSNLKVTKTSAAASAMPAALSFVTGAASLAKEFDVALATNSPYATGDATVLQLTPKSVSAQVDKLFFVVGADGHVEKSIVIDSSGNTNELQFADGDTKAKIDRKWFEFDPKRVPTYKVEDADARKP